MSIFPSRNWTDELRRQSELELEAQRRQEWYATSQLNQFRQAQWNAEWDRVSAKSEAVVEESAIAREAKEGTVIEGVVARKPQPHLT